MPTRLEKEDTLQYLMSYFKDAAERYLTLGSWSYWYGYDWGKVDLSPLHLQVL
jgi:hypothetical protein